ncbi:MAG: DUF2800 domain-containing protein [Anaerotignaceae bacterium]
MPDVHAKLSASGAKKWLNCPGSIVLEAQIPEVESDYAKGGTTAHALGEAKIRLATKEVTRAKYHKAIKDLEITEDMEQYTDDYRDFVIERFNLAKSVTPDATLLLEQRLDYSQWAPGGFGTGDVVIIADGTIEIIDLKYGKGVEVEAEDNPQLKLYALGALTAFDYLYDIKSITMTIYQPRMDNISSCEMLVEDLLEWANTEVVPRAKKADSDTEEFCTGKHCEEGFCNARPICRAYAEKQLEAAVYDFKLPSALSVDEIADILEQAESLAKWATLIKDYALDQAVNHGVTYPGYKIVEGRSNRAWSVDDTLVAAQLIGKGYRDDDIWPRKLKGITAMEQLLSKKTFKDILGDLVIKPQGKPTLVPFDDKRPEINSTDNANKDFTGLIEN